MKTIFNESENDISGKSCKEASKFKKGNFVKNEKRKKEEKTFSGLVIKMKKLFFKSLLL